MGAAPVRLALLALPGIEAGMADPAGWMTPAEHGRAARITAPLRRRQFLAGHWQARRLAADICGGQPQDWRWCESGPHRCLARGTQSLHVSLAHCADRVAVALASVPVGVDIELPRTRRDFGALLREIGAPREAAGFDRLAAGQREAVFLRIWTLKEAHGKREGVGLQPGLARGWAAVPAASGAAEAATWSGAWGSLAVCAAQGMMVEAHIPGGGGPEFWRFVRNEPQAAVIQGEQPAG